jgi:hypothetical protein
MLEAVLLVALLVLAANVVIPLAAPPVGVSATSTPTALPGGRT